MYHPNQMFYDNQAFQQQQQRIAERMRHKRFLQIGSRIGLLLAVLVEAIFVVGSGFIVAILVMLEVPLVGELFDCLALVAGLLLAVAGFYLGMLAGQILYLMRRNSHP